MELHNNIFIIFLRNFNCYAHLVTSCIYLWIIDFYWSDCHCLHISDGSSGYVEDGREIFDEDHYDPNDDEAKSGKKSKGMLSKWRRKLTSFPVLTRRTRLFPSQYNEANLYSWILLLECFWLWACNDDTCKRRCQIISVVYSLKLDFLAVGGLNNHQQLSSTLIKVFFHQTLFVRIRVPL